MTVTARAYIGLGSNLNRPEEQVRAGISALHELPQTRVVHCSALYRTAPVGSIQQPDFINAVCAVDTSLDPEVLMQRLLAIETSRGRTREDGAQGGPRTLDLDLLLYGDSRISTPNVTVPHPRLHERAFVLYPLFDIAPTLRVPGHGAIADLLERCKTQVAERLSGSAH